MNDATIVALKLVRDALRSGQDAGDNNKSYLADLKKRGPAAVVDSLRLTENIQQQTRQGEGSLAALVRDYQATEDAQKAAEEAKRQSEQAKIAAERDKAGFAEANYQLTKRVDDAQTELNRINGEIITKDTEIADLHRRNGEAGGRYSAVCSERDRLRTERDRAQATLDEARLDQIRLNRENGQLEGSNTELQSQNKYNKKWNVGLGLATAALVLYAIASPFTGKSNAEAKPTPVVEAPKYSTEKEIAHIEYRVGDKWLRQNEAPTGALESRVAIIVGEAKEPTYVTMTSVDAAQPVFEAAKKARENGNKAGGYLRSKNRTEFYPDEYVSIFSAIAGKTEDGDLSKPSKKDAEYTMLNIVNKGGGFAEITGGN